MIKETQVPCLIMISEDAERTMSTCLGISANLKPSDIDEDLIEKSEIIYLELPCEFRRMQLDE